MTDTDLDWIERQARAALEFVERARAERATLGLPSPLSERSAVDTLNMTAETAPVQDWERLSVAARRTRIPIETLRRHAKKTLKKPDAFARLTDEGIDPDTGERTRRLILVSPPRLARYLAKHPLLTRNDAKKLKPGAK